MRLFESEFPIKLLACYWTTPTVENFQFECIYFTSYVKFLLYIFIYFTTHFVLNPFSAIVPLTKHLAVVHVKDAT